MKVFLSLEILLFIFFIFCRILSGVGWSDVIWFGLAALSDSRQGRAAEVAGAVVCLKSVLQESENWHYKSFYYPKL